MNNNSRNPLSSHRKSLLPYLLFLIAILMLLSACKQVETPSTPDKLTPTPSSQVTQSPTPQITASTPTQKPDNQIPIKTSEMQGLLLQFWHPFEGNAAKTLQHLADEFSLTNPYGILVMPESRGYDLDRDLQNSSEQNSAPDIVLLPHYTSLSTEEISKLAIPLNTFIADQQWSISEEEIVDFYAEDSLGLDRNTPILALPAGYSAPILLYNTTYASELGWDAPPKTIEFFVEQVCAETDISGQTAGWLTSGSSAEALTWLYGFGAEVWSDVDETAIFSTTETASALEILRNMAEQGCTQTTDFLDDSIESFAERQSLIVSARPEDIFIIEDILSNTAVTDTWQMIPFPTNTDQETLIQSHSRYVITSIDEAKQLASWLFIKFLSQPQNHALLIQSTGELPATLSSFEYLKDFATQHSPWGGLLQYTQYMRKEPNHPRWQHLQNILVDSFAEAINPDSTFATISEILSEMEILVEEINLYFP